METKEIKLNQGELNRLFNGQEVAVFGTIKGVEGSLTLSFKPFEVA